MKVSMSKKCFAVLIFLLALAIDASAQEVEVNRFNVTARVDVAASAVDVRASLNISNVAQSSKPKLYFRLTKLAKVTSATVNGGAAQVETADDRRAITLNQIILTPGASIAGGATATVDISYRIEAPESTPLIHVYPGEVFLAPESVWVPMPSTLYTLYGPTTAPTTLTVTLSNAADGYRAASSGAARADGGGTTFDQQLNTLPLLVAGSFDQPVVAERAGIKIEIYTQPGISPSWTDPKAGSGALTRTIASRLSEEAGLVAEYLTKALGPAPAGATFRVISSARAGNIVVPGALLLNEQVFRRDVVGITTVETLADALGHLWIDGRTRLRGQEARPGPEGGAGRKARSPAFIRDSIPRYLAALYVEERFGKKAGNDSFSRMRWGYTPVAQSGRDAELAVQTIFLPNYTVSVLTKGPLVLRLLGETLGREKLIGAVRELISGPQTRIVTAEDFRTSLLKAGSPGADLLFTQWVDNITEPDVIVGAPLPSDKAGVQRVNLRNMGTGEVAVKLVASTASGKQITSIVTVPSENITAAEIQTGEKITALALDPDKLLIQTNYDNDERDGDWKSTKASAQTLYNQSVVAFNKGQFPEAEAKLKEALVRDPSNPLILSWLARTLAAENKGDEAIAQANAALKDEPPNPPATAWARITLGQVLLARNQAAQAVEHLRRALVDAEETPAQFAVRELLVKAERAANAVPPVDEKVRAYITTLDSAIRQPDSDKLFTLIMRNNLKRFVQGITVARPNAWTTEILRADRIDANRTALDVRISAKAEGRDQAGTAVLVLYRVPTGWMLEDVQMFEVK
jgi:hypothetical protein